MIRSGATDYELQGRIRGAVDIPLCGAGVTEAEQTASLLLTAPPVAIYSSEELSAVETSHIIGRALGLRPRTLPNLQNLDLGLWQGMLVEDIRRKQPRLSRQWLDNPWAIAPPDGELVEEACDRVEAAVALVVPAPLDRIVRWLVAGEAMGDLWTRDPRPEPPTELPVAAQWARRVRVARRQPTPI